LPIAASTKSRAARRTHLIMFPCGAICGCNA
jgi:hypothetical protein